MIDATPAPCPVHPTTYHERAQVLPTGSRRIFRFESVVGLPRRCSTLETELMDADREVDLMDYLWVLERRGRGSRVFTAIVSMSLGVLIGLVARGDSGTPERDVAIAFGVAAAFGILIEAVSSKVFTVRLGRVLDWRKRVGF